MLTKQKISEIHKDISAAMEAISKKHNLSIAKSRITYGNEGFRLNCEFGDKSAIGEQNPLFLRELDKHGWKNGLDRSHIGKEFVVGTRTVIFEGLKNANTAVLKEKGTNAPLQWKANLVAQKLSAPQMTPVLNTGELSSILGVKGH